MKKTKQISLILSILLIFQLIPAINAHAEEKAENEIAGLPLIQRSILQSLGSCVRPGGVLIYSTCTILRAENEEVVEDFLRRNPVFSPDDFTIGAVRSINGCYTFWPHIDGTDGFFAAKLRRNE